MGTMASATQLIPLDQIGLMLREKRGDRGVREVAAEIGIGHSTVSRIERNYPFDASTYIKIIEWLASPTDEDPTTPAPRDDDDAIVDAVVAGWNVQLAPSADPTTPEAQAGSEGVAWQPDDTMLEDAAKAAFVKAQSVYRADHDHFPLRHTWETTSESVREGWRSIAYATLEAAITPPLGTQPEPRLPRLVLSPLPDATYWKGAYDRMAADAAHEKQVAMLACEDAVTYRAERDRMAARNVELEAERDAARKQHQDFVISVLQASREECLAAGPRDEKDDFLAHVKKLRARADAALAMNDATRDVLAERRRQIDIEGWTAEHDDKHDAGEIATAAACYAWGATGVNYVERLGMRSHVHRVRTVWPWSLDWWKPTNRRRDLIKAGALILAEIERLDRAALATRHDPQAGRE